MEYLLFSVNGKTIAMSFEQIKEIIALPYLQDVPYYGKGYLGMLNYRGTTLPVYDSARLLFGETLEIKPSTKLIILGKDKLIGLAFDDILKNVKGEKLDSKDEGIFNSMLLVGDSIYPLVELETIYELVNSDKEIKQPEFCVVAPDTRKALQLRNSLSEQKADKNIDDEEGYLIFGIDNEYFALKSDIVSEILKVEGITPVPTAPDYIRGIISLRGNITTVLDLKKYYFADAITDTAAARIIILNYEEQKIGLLVDRVIDFVSIQKPEKRLPHFISSPLSSLVTKQFEFNGALVSILDLNKFLDDLYQKDGERR